MRLLDYYRQYLYHGGMSYTVGLEIFWVRAEALYFLHTFPCFCLSATWLILLLVVVNTVISYFNTPRISLFYFVPSHQEETKGTRDCLGGFGSQGQIHSSRGRLGVMILLCL